MTQPAERDGASKSGRQQRQKPAAKKAGRRLQTGNAAGGYRVPVFAVAAAVAFSFCLEVAQCFSSSDIFCPTELIRCVGNEDCSYCLGMLQDDDFLLGGDDPEVCSELYGHVCEAAGSLNCNTENEELIDLFTCAAEDIYGCADFTTCAATPAPAATETTSYPSAAPSAASAAPTGFDGSRGGGGGEDMSSAAPTASPSASPTAFEDPSSLLDESAVSGGVISRFAGGGGYSSSSSVFFSTVSAAAMAGTFVAMAATAAVTGWGV